MTNREGLERKVPTVDRKKSFQPEGGACAECGMWCKHPREYHPFAVCQLFKALRNSESVRGNIKAVIEYGMRAERAGVSVDDAMADFNTVHNAETEKKPLTPATDATVK